MKRVAVVGGGISGLSAAFYLERLRRAGAQVEYSLFESSPRLGGVIRTERFDDCLIEAGPDSFLTSKPWAADLARDAGIGDQLLPSNDRKRKTYILDRGKLLPMPDGLQMMVPTKAWPIMQTELLSPSTKFKMLGEFVSPPEPLAPDVDESVAAFIRRHFGDEVVTKLADPLLAGIYGGDSNRLSARATLPAMVVREAEHHSLVRAAIKAMRERGSQPSLPLFTSFRTGMQQLVDAVVAGIDQRSVRLNAPVASLIHLTSGWRVATSASVEDFSHVILALPAYASAALLATYPDLAAQLNSIQYTDSITVSLVYRCDKLRRCTELPPGFGFLVPPPEKKKMIACTFVHNKFDSRCGDDHVLLRAFLTRAGGATDAQLIAAVESELASILKIEVPTEFARIYRWPRAMPQYEVGHLEKLAHIEDAAHALPGLRLIGNAYHGLGIPDCVREGKLAAEEVLAG